ncbi:MAG: hypothetical protein PHW34_01450 [Hespellia sp.]|nr:hypothetical protein [Hespellia sp.]
MKHKKLLSIATATLTLALFVLSGCQKKEDVLKLNAPFTKMDWNNSKDDVIAAEGDDYETYDSVYNGTTYSFNKKYNSEDGTVKYMFDDKDKLMCVAWSYSTTDLKALEDLYTKINDDLTNEYGDSGYNTDEAENTINNYGNIWYLDFGDIVLSAMTTEENKALQVAFLHPDVSYSEDE